MGAIDLQVTICISVRCFRKCSLKPLILQAIIEGYKSYKDQTISEPFDQHINVVGMLLAFRSLYLSNCHTAV